MYNIRGHAAKHSLSCPLSGWLAGDSFVSTPWQRVIYQGIPVIIHVTEPGREGDSTERRVLVTANDVMFCSSDFLLNSFECEQQSHLGLMTVVMIGNDD